MLLRAHHLMNYVADLDALLNGAAGHIVSPAEPVTLVGHSTGAAVAATFASLRPGRVSALVTAHAHQVQAEQKCENQGGVWVDGSCD